MSNPRHGAGVFGRKAGVPRGADCSLAQELNFLMFREFKITDIRLATNNFSENNFLGKGNFAEVYRGTLLNGKSYAFKRLKSPAKEGSQAMVLLERELKSLSRLSHSNIIRLHGFCLAKADHVFVYELAEGGTLEDALKGDPVEGCKLFLKKRLRIALQVAEALTYLHSQGIIHRDIKPANILLTAKLEAKLADFGLLKLLDPLNEDTITKLAGTIGYMDPESLRTGRVSFSSDVYAMGIVLLSLITGKGPGITNPDEIELAKSLEEGRKQRPQEASSRPESRGGGRQGIMGLRRFVAILSKAGEMKALLDPSLWPLLRQFDSTAATGHKRRGPQGGNASLPGEQGSGIFRGRSRNSKLSTEERHRKELIALRSCIALGMQCSQEDPRGRPSMSSVAEDLRMMIKGVPPFLSGTEFLTFSVLDINVMTSDRTFPLSSRSSSSLFCGKDQWDGETCIVQHVLCNGGPASQDAISAVDDAKAAFQVRHPSLLPMIGCCNTGDKDFWVYGLPLNHHEGCELLEHCLLGTGCDLLGYMGKQRTLLEPKIDYTLARPSTAHSSSSHRRGSLMFGSQDSFPQPFCPPRGKTLHAVEPLPFTVRCGIAIEVAEALQHLHDKGFIHGAIHAGVVLVRTSGGAFLIGHGRRVRPPSAKVHAEDCEHRSLPRESALEVSQGACCGTAAHVAQTPDLQALEGPTRQKDVEAFGALLLELFSGRPGVVKQPADLAVVERPCLAAEPLILEEWVKRLLDQGKTALLARSMPPIRQVGQQTAVRNLQGQQALQRATSCASTTALDQTSSCLSSLDHLLESCLNLALQCCRADPSAQPALEEAISRLKAIRTSIETLTAGISSPEAKHKAILQRTPGRKRMSA